MLGPRQVGFSPRFDRRNDLLQGGAGCGEGVAGPRGHGRLDPLRDDARLGQLVEPLGQGGGIAPADGSSQVVETTRLGEQGPHDLKRPFALEQRNRVTRGAVLLDLRLHGCMVPKGLC